MAQVPANRTLLGKVAILGLVVVLGALLACRRNGPNQPGASAAANVSATDAAAPDAGDAGPDALAPDAAPDGAVDGGRACTIGGRTQTAGTQIMMFREAGDFDQLLAAADAGANQQQRTEQFRTAGGILVAFGTPCQVFETASAMVRVQVTQGSWLGTQGWVSADSLEIP